MASNTAEPKCLTDHQQIHDWLVDYCQIYDQYTIADDGRVSVQGSVNFNHRPLEFAHFAVAFDVVDGDFICSYCPKLESLHGAPQHVGGEFCCRACSALMTLEGCPRRVGGHFDGGIFNLITTLEGSPLRVGGQFICATDTLTDLIGVNEVGGYMVILDPAMPLPASTVKQLLVNRIAVDEPIPGIGHPSWIATVNDYHASGDLLTAIAQFEKYFKVPFHSTIAPTALIPELPGL